MASFFVGQRVRIIYTHPSHAEFLGREATITEPSIYLNAWRLSVDGIGAHAQNGTPFAADEDGLEPLIPPGMESLAETLALWLPEDERASA